MGTTELHTNILTTRWRCIGAVIASFHAIINGQAVVVSTKYCASQLFNRFYGGLGRARRRYVYRDFEMLCTLKHPALIQGTKGKHGGDAHHSGA